MGELRWWHVRGVVVDIEGGMWRVEVDIEGGMWSGY